MTTPVVKSLIDEQIADIERSLQILGAWMPSELPRELPIRCLPPQYAAAIKAGRIAVRPRQ